LAKLYNTKLLAAIYGVTMSKISLKTTISPFGTFLFVLIAVCLSSALAFSQHQHSSHSSDRKIYTTDAEVVDIDTANSSLTVKHGPIPAVGWEAMTMGFKVADLTLLEGVKKGDKLSIDILFEGPNYYIVDLEVLN
jgi:Cu/Ag efflux protein CusF